MELPWKSLIFLLVMLNPFSQVLYMWDVMRQMSWRQFTATYLRASVLSWGVFAVFAVTGEVLFVDVFQVRVDSFRIFGGLLILLIALRYFTHGAGSNLLFRGDATDLAPQISLPYMVGPGTIWVSIEVGRRSNLLIAYWGIAMIVALAGIAAVLLVNLAIVSFSHRSFAHLEGRRETMLGKYFAILMRTNALFIGAISVEMIVSGTEAVVRGPAV